MFPRLERARALTITVLGVLLCLFTLFEVNFHYMQPQSRLAVFGLVGIVLCFLLYPVDRRLKENRALRIVDLLLALATVVCFGYVIVQTEPVFRPLWLLGQSLGDRAGSETTADFWVGLGGLLLVIEATRRSIGLALPILALAFVAHAYFGEVLPVWLLPHAKMEVDQIVSVTFLQSLGVFGPAAKVMFTYVFLFVIFGAFLEMTGATQFIVDFSERVFGRSPGGPAKVAVLGSGLMGSLSGSAVANAVTTGTFTIPMMRSAGFRPHVAGGITAAAASGGALVPPVMGAGAYMMLEIVEPPVTFLEVARAALIPAFLYYFSIFMIVHFYARRTHTAESVDSDASRPRPSLLALIFQFEGILFFGALAALILFLVLGYSPFRAVTYSLLVILVLGLVRFCKRLSSKAAIEGIEAVIEGMKAVIEAMAKSARNGVSLVSASACVGILIGIVQSTGIAGDFNVAVKGVVEESLFLALIGIMGCSIVLGMGVPSVVCYLLMATLMGTLLKELGVIPLAAHLFIFYFGMMSMVTPPVALAAYASASIARAKIMRTALSAFLFSLVGFTLPFMFVYRPELLLMSNTPELRIVEVKVEEQKPPGRATVIGFIERIGEGVSGAKLEFSPRDRGGWIRTATGDTDGRFELGLEGGEWQVVTRTEEGDFLHLGRLSLDLSGGSGEVTALERARFRDQRLSVLQVLVGTGAAALGILALAAGIAGFLFAPLTMVPRLLAFAAAGLLLFPARGLSVGDLHLAVSDLAGLTLIAVIAVLNRRSADAS